MLADRDADAAARIARSICASAGRSDAIAVDITQPPSVSAMLEAVHRRHGRVDALVNSAYPTNRNYGRQFFQIEYADFCENLAFHLGGYFLVSQKAAAYFQSQGGGNIVNIASIYGTMTPRFELYEGTGMTMPVEYAAIKAAIIQLTRYMAQYLKGTNIRVNCLSPGGVYNGQPTEFVERYSRHAGMLQPNEVAGTLVYLLSEASAPVTGQNIVVDRGFSL